jgi:peptidoglycan DL-endopeptidase LytE
MKPHHASIVDEESLRLRVSKRGHRRIGVPAKKFTVIEQAADEAKDDEYEEYRVRRGDTVEKLAVRFNFDKDEFKDLNKTAKRRLAPGSMIFIPKMQEGPEEAPGVLTDRVLRPWRNEEERGLLVKVSASFAGAPYRFGGDTVRGIDCSAFVRKMYEIFEVQLPRCAREQFYAGPKVDKNDLVTGDLVFFKTIRFAKYPSHVGIYVGDGKFIHTSSFMKRGVRVDHLADAYFARTYAGAVRVKAPPAGNEDAN